MKNKHAMALSSSFDLVQAAEALLKSAKKLAAVTNPGDDGNNLDLRRRIAQTAKKIAFETAPKIDVVKSDWIVVSSPSPTMGMTRLTAPDRRGRSMEHLHRL